MGNPNNPAQYPAEGISPWDGPLGNYIDQGDIAEFNRAVAVENALKNITDPTLLAKLTAAFAPIGEPVAVAEQTRAQNAESALATSITGLGPGGSSGTPYGAPAPLSNVVTTVGSGNYTAPLEYFSGAAWGVDQSNNITKSTDGGVTWSVVQASPATNLIRLMLLSDGEVLAVGLAGAYKSSGWASNPATATWTLKVTPYNTAQFQPFSLAGNGTKLILGEYSNSSGSSGVGTTAWADSRYASISTDSGNTWTRAYDSEAVNVPSASSTPGSAWSATTAVTVGTQVTLPGGVNGDPVPCVLSCTVAGTTGSTQPTVNGSQLGSTFTDGTVTWKVLVDPSQSHVHGVEYDAYADRFIVSEGHAVGAGIWYSTDNGATWTRPTGTIANPSVTTITATSDGLVCGCDNATWQGLAGIVRQSAVSSEALQVTYKWRTGATGTDCFSYRNSVQPGTGIVYVTFNSDTADLNVPPVILAGTVYTGSKVYSWPTLPIIRLDGFRNFIFTSANRYIGRVVANGSTYLMSAVPGKPAANNIIDTGGIFGGTAADGTAMAVGTRSTTGSTLRGTAAGVLATTVGAVQDATAVGNAATASGNQGTAVGSASQATGSNGTAIGKSAVASASNSTAVGEAATASGTSATAAGQLATASGASAVAYGVLATAAGNSATAIGTQANAAFNNSVAVGQGVKPGGINSVSVGNSSSARQASTTALGYSARAGGSSATSVGALAVAAGNSSTAIGTQALVGYETTLSSPITVAGGAILSLPVSGTGTNGQTTPALPSTPVTLTINDGAGNTQTWTTSGAAAAGATSIPVSSQVPSVDFPSGSSVSGGASSGVAIGQGSSIDPSSGSAVAIGQGAKVMANHGSSVAIGQGVQTTTLRQFAIGTTHIEMLDLPSIPGVPAAGAMRIGVIDDGVYNNGAGGGTASNKGRLLVRFPGGDLTLGVEGAAVGAVKAGTATLVGGTVTVANTSITATSKIRPPLHQTIGGTPGALYISAKNAGASFTISSTSSSDTSTVYYEIEAY